MADPKCSFCNGKGEVVFNNYLNMPCAVKCPCVEAEYQKNRAEGYKNLARQFLNTICQVAEVVYRILPITGTGVHEISTKHFENVSEIIDARKD